VLALSALLASFAFAAAAGALSPPPGEGRPASPGSCVFGITPAAADGAMEPGSVTVSVTQLPTIDEPLTVQLFRNGSVVQSRVVNPPPGLPVNFNPIDVVAGDTVSVNYILRNVSTYSTVCATVAGQTVVTVRGAQAARLAFTGSSNTSTFVLVGVAALVLGLVFVVGSRRRHRVSA
jgi:LPXTG-motif cell wall-anchored protein